MRYLTLAVVGLAVPLAGCNLHGRPAVERVDARASIVRTAATEPVTPETVVSPGIVEPWGSQVDVAATESGRLAGVFVGEGDVVEKGRLLAALDDDTQRHGVELARADLAEARAALERIARGSTLEELRQARAERDAAQAQSDLARADADRVARLHADGVVSDEAADRAAATARTQSAIAERAAARLAEIEGGSRIEDRRAAEARVSAAAASLRLAEAALAHRQVLAPAAGTVLLSRMHAGEFYTAGSGALFVLGDVTRLQVRLEVDEIDAAAPVPGAACVVYSDAGVRLAEGRIVRLAPKLGRRALPLESPTARADVRVREVFVEVPATSALIPSQRVWGHLARTTAGSAAPNGA